MVYRTAPVSMTLNNSKPSFQDHAFRLYFDEEYLINFIEGMSIVTMEANGKRIEAAPQLSNGTSFDDLE